MQLAIDFITSAPRARRTDPATSHKAAEKAAAFAGSHCDRILAALDALGSATAHEVEKHTGLSVAQIDRRRHELVKAGKVRLLTHNGLPVEMGGVLLERDGFNVMARVG